MVPRATTYPRGVMQPWLAPDAHIAELTTRCLFITGFIQAGFAAYMIFAGSLRGAGDTRFIMFATGLTAIVAVAIGRISERTFHWADRGIALWAWWWILTGWIFVLGALYLLRFMGGKWKSMRVIEPELANADCGMRIAE